MTLAATSGPPSRRLAPLLSGTSAGSLGAGDLEEIGVSIVAVDVLELLLSAGWDRVRAAGGLRPFTAWEGEIVAVALYVEAPQAPGGWRARQLPQLLRQREEVLRVRSPVDGRIAEVSIEQLRAEAAELGADDTAAIGEQPSRAWTSASAPPPDREVVVSELAAAEATHGRYLSRRMWRPVDSASMGPLDVECACRSCAIATGPYIAHLWAAHEITAEHLLAWHNHHQLRLVIEEGATSG